MQHVSQRTNTTPAIACPCQSAVIAGSDLVWYISLDTEHSH